MDAPGALQHVWARGIERRALFHSDADRYDMLRRFATSAASTGLTIYAWSLMPNHLHLVTRTGRISLSRVMKSILGGYAGRFNSRYQRCGHLFQNRFGSSLVADESYLAALVRYVHSNPLRAGLVESLDALEAYRWTGHAALMGRTTLPWQETAEVLSLFGNRVATARDALRHFMQDGLDAGMPECLRGNVVRRTASGIERLSADARGREAWRLDDRVLGSCQSVERLIVESSDSPIEPALVKAARPVVDSILQEVAASHGIDVVDILGGGKRPAAVRARIEFCSRARDGCAWRVAEIAAYLGITKVSVYQLLRRRESSKG